MCLKLFNVGTWIDEIRSTTRYFGRYSSVKTDIRTAEPLFQLPSDACDNWLA